MDRENLEKLSKSELIALLLGKKKTKPTRSNRPTQTLRRKQKVVADRPGMVLNPETNRWIKIGGPTYLKRQKVKPWTIRNPETNRWIKIGGSSYKKVFPMQHALNEINKMHQKINKTSKSIDNKYKRTISSIDDVKPKTKITQIRKALKDSTKSFAVDIVDDEDPLIQLTKTRKVIRHHLNKELYKLKGFKYIETLKMTFEKRLEKKQP